jgi:hypothetical protein
MLRAADVDFCLWGRYHLWPDSRTPFRGGGQLRRRNALCDLRGERLILLLALLFPIAFSVPSSGGEPQAVAEESQETYSFEITDSEDAHCSSFQLPIREARPTALIFFEQVRPTLFEIRSEIAPRAPPHS